VANSEYPHGSDRNVRITGNTVRHVRGDSIVLGGVVGGRVDHNVSAWGGELGACSTRQCGRRGGPTTASAAIWPILSKNIVIEHNEVYGEQADSGDGEAFDVDLSTRNIVIQDNYAHDNEGGGIMLCGAKETSVRFNILQNNAKAAFTFTCANKVDGVRIYNNTVYQKRSVGASAVVRTLRGFGGTRIAFLNNIVYTWGPGHYTFPSKPVATYNTFVGTHHHTEPTGTGNSRRSPGLKSPGSGRVGMRTLGGYHLRTLTGAQKGHVLPASVTQDLFGGRVNPSAPHRGASNTTR
jgi:parallel beta-helix repeat protein